jgi:hypothetical protein
VNPRWILPVLIKNGLSIFLPKPYIKVRRPFGIEIFVPNPKL